MRKTSLIILVIAILMGGSAAYLTRSWLKDHVSASPTRPAGTIVVAAESLAYGTPMTADSVVEIPWFSDTLPEGAFALKNDLLNGDRRVVLSPMKRGEAVLRSKITGPGQRASLASLLDEGRRAVTVQVDDVRGVAGFVLPGDFVDIVIIAEDGSTKRQSYSDILLEHIKVLAIDQVASEGEGQPTVAKAVTVEVTKEQAQKILTGDEYWQAVLDPLSTAGIKAGTKSPRQRERYRPDNSGACATRSASPASSGRRSARGAVKYGEDLHRTKWGDQGVHGNAD